MKGITALLLATLSTFAFAANFETERFDVDVKIMPNRSVEMTEYITVRYTVPQHGLMRTLPIRLKGERLIRQVRYIQEGASIDGQPTTVSETTNRNEAVYKIGDPNKLLEGRHTIVIRYRIWDALTDFEAASLPTGEPGFARTEFFWNMLPLHWPTRIPMATVKIAFPTPTAEKYAARVIFGPFGERTGIQVNSDGTWVGRLDLVDAKFDSPTSLKFSILKPCQPGWTATVILGLPIGTVERGSAVSAPIPTPDATPDVLDNFSSGVASLPSRPWGLALAAIPAGLFALLRKKAPPRPLVVRFDPPDGASAPDCGVLIDDRFDAQDFLATLVAIAQKGHWTLSKVGEQTVLDLRTEKRQKIVLDDFESAVFDSLQPYAPVVSSDTLRESFGPQFRAFGRQIASRHEALSWAESHSAARGCSGCGLMGISVPIALVAIPYVGFWSLLGIPLAIIAGIIGVNRWPKYSEAGQTVRWQNKGLREFIARAQSKELQWAADKAPDQALFERLLPYAIAFGLVKEWSKAFEGIQFASPDWYSGGSSDWTDVYLFNAMVNDFSDEWTPAANEAIQTHDFDNFSSGGGGWSDGDSGFGSSSSGSDWSSSGGSDGGGSFDSGGSSGDGGGGGGGDSW